MRIILLLLFLSILELSFSQTKYSVGEQNADCNNAINITLDSIIISSAPVGKGAKEELFSVDNDYLYFKNEHNIVWYYFTVPSNAELSFDIIPDNINDDYDFILFESEAKDVCNEIAEKSLKPVRTNISRVDKEINGVTGLNYSASNNFVGEGVGDNYSSIVKLSKHKYYYLVLDNVYGGDGGHKIVMNYKWDNVVDIKPEKQIIISVMDINDSSNIDASITIVKYDANYNADTLKKIYSSKFTMEVNNGDYYKMFFSKDNYVQEQKSVKIFEKDTIVNVNVALQNVSLGNSFVLKNVYFYGGTANFAGNYRSELKRLHNILKDNPDLKIEIHGHVNLYKDGIFKKREKFYHELSEERAKAVYNYLLRKGIDKKRMKYIGFGYSNMVIPNPKTEAEMAKNRRVEVKIVAD